jgi:RNA recognition motif-containing protein
MSGARTGAIGHGARSAHDQWLPFPYTVDMSQMSENKVFVGNLPHSTTEDYLRELFEESGHRVEELMIIKDKETGRSRGFAFVTFVPEVDIAKVIKDFNGQSFMGRHLTVNAATPKAPSNTRRW